MPKPIANPWLKNVRVKRLKKKLRINLDIPVVIDIPDGTLQLAGGEAQRQEIVQLVLDRLALDVKEELAPAILTRLEKIGL